MVKVTIVITYIDKGKQRELRVSASAKYYTEAIAKALKYANEISGSLPVLDTFVESVTYGGV